MTAWSIRLAQPADGDALPAIERAAGALFRTVEGLDGVAGTHAIPAAQQRRYIAKGHCLVAEAHGDLVGFIVTEPLSRELHIREFSVHPDWQGQGIGTILLRALEIDARNSGFAALALTTFREVPWNEPFYARHGFIEVSDPSAHPHFATALKLEAEHGLPPERRVAMIKFLR